MSGVPPTPTYDIRASLLPDAGGAIVSMRGGAVSDEQREILNLLGITKDVIADGNLSDETLGKFIEQLKNTKCTAVSGTGAIINQGECPDISTVFLAKLKHTIKILNESGASVSPAPVTPIAPAEQPQETLKTIDNFKPDVSPENQAKLNHLLKNNSISISSDITEEQLDSLGLKEAAYADLSNLNPSLYIKAFANFDNIINLTLRTELLKISKGISNLDKSRLDDITDRVKISVDKVKQSDSESPISYKDVSLDNIKEIQAILKELYELTLSDKSSETGSTTSTTPTTTSSTENSSNIGIANFKKIEPVAAPVAAPVDSSLDFLKINKKDREPAVNQELLTQADPTEPTLETIKPPLKDGEYVRLAEVKTDAPAAAPPQNSKKNVISPITGNSNLFRLSTGGSKTYRRSLKHKVAHKKTAKHRKVSSSKKHFHRTVKRSHHKKNSKKTTRKH